MKLSPAGKKRAPEAAARRAELGLDPPAKQAPKTFYHPDFGREICLLIAKGQSVIQICRRPHMPHPATIYTWLRTYPEFLDKYLCARRIACDRLIDEMIAIADDSSRDVIIKKTRDGREMEVLNPDAVRRDRLRISARRWLLDRYTVKGIHCI